MGDLGNASGKSCHASSFLRKQAQLPRTGAFIVFSPEIVRVPERMTSPGASPSGERLWLGVQQALAYRWAGALILSGLRGDFIFHLECSDWLLKAFTEVLLLTPDPYFCLILFLDLLLSHFSVWSRTRLTLQSGDV